MDNAPTAVKNPERLVVLDQRLGGVLKLQRDQAEALAHAVYRLGGERLKILDQPEDDPVQNINSFADAYEWRIRQVEQISMEFSHIIKAFRSLI